MFKKVFVLVLSMTALACSPLDELQKENTDENQENLQIEDPYLGGSSRIYLEQAVSQIDSDEPGDAYSWLRQLQAAANVTQPPANTQFRIMKPYLGGSSSFYVSRAMGLLKNGHQSQAREVLETLLRTAIDV